MCYLLNQNKIKQTKQNIGNKKIKYKYVVSILKLFEFKSSINFIRNQVKQSVI